MNLCRKTNPKIRFLLTASPVPLTATMSGNHVLVATTESKSILRAVAGNLKSKFDFVDYFSSYEIITSTAYRSVFFEPNLRSVNLNGVNFVMDNFFNSYAKKFSVLQKGDSITKSKIIETAKNKSSPIALEEKNSVVCEEELLEAFNYPKSK